MASCIRRARAPVIVNALQYSFCLGMKRSNDIDVFSFFIFIAYTQIKYRSRLQTAVRGMCVDRRSHLFCILQLLNIISIAYNFFYTYDMLIVDPIPS